VDKEFIQKKSKPDPYRMSTEGARVGAPWRGLGDQYISFAEDQRMPQDLFCKTATVQQNLAVGSNDYHCHWGVSNLNPYLIWRQQE